MGQGGPDDIETPCQRGRSGHPDRQGTEVSHHFTAMGAVELVPDPAALKRVKLAGKSRPMK